MKSTHAKHRSLTKAFVTLGTIVLHAALLNTTRAIADETLPLYAGAIPNAIAGPDEESVRDPKESWRFLQNISHPTLGVFLPALRNASGAAVIILPGGSYRGVSIDKEGTEVARAFNELGVAAFVLKYRTPSDRTMRDRTTGPLQDIQQAIRVVRSRATEWHIDTSRVGLVGFSAGGHLAGLAGTHFDKPVISDSRAINLRPSFLVLVYPVVSFNDSLTHALSRTNLLGAAPDERAIALYSNELQVTAQTPPTFLVHAADDGSVKVENSLRLFEALRSKNVPVEMHIYERGGHGFGLVNATTTDRWFERCAAWLRSQSLLSDSIQH